MSTRWISSRLTANSARHRPGMSVPALVSAVNSVSADESTTGTSNVASIGLSILPMAPAPTDAACAGASPSVTGRQVDWLAEAEAQAKDSGRSELELGI